MFWGYVFSSCEGDRHPGCQKKYKKSWFWLMIFSSCEGDRYPGVPKKIAQRAPSGPPCPAGVI